MKFNEIIKKLNSSVINSSLTNHPDNNPNIIGLAPVDEAITGQLSYIEGNKFAAMVDKTAASALILPLDEALQNRASEKGIAWIAIQEPRLMFAHVINLFYQPFHPAPGIHPSAVIDPSVKLGKDIYIGPHVVIAHDVTIGDNVCIHPNVVIYPQVSLGNCTILHANCTIHECTQIGSNCVIHSGAAIGSEGFGFVPTPQGWFKMEQSGCVILEDGVEIGCNSAVDRPAVGTTSIGRNTKLDNLVHVAHSCKIGDNCALAGQVGLAGGVRLGRGVILAGQVGVANQVNIGDGVIATAQTGITNNISPGEIVSSSPAVSNKLYLKVSAIYKRLPEMYQTLKRLQKKIEKS
ncbi:MAG: UDP-3-O-(3-hydroxymyristoyl)glucosamine N-acyltransferase [cyanobacterium endosymbiont of Rhopalodia musculus]|uniref:UDP-3-O-(3-hydroxymyristoyl)glucosamine N-acyltransferase n=1 Tax=cyanobacterium endosymbiont of Epithemia clementina EcSB TaxID=3034674 RepID=UPI00248177A0|nr:UDP-3-O-(3-hydroxymyristoyl)glucosamine N-acyltransferase [cyanobacterium endosymbiont of Epithemia clementina EcSB]WGT68038.1 UDP-3-O-(3-hydroxymyristoyl)glucosamine N-acyltransferase [cyanobacterium endosymbiont of Epithemia clementina EcSB]